MAKERKNAGGIKQDEDGHFIVRLNYKSKRFAPKDYTKLYKCNTLEDTKEQIEKVKRILDRGEDPFDKRKFGDYIEEYFTKLENKGKENTAYIYRKSYEKYAKKILHNLKPDRINKNHGHL